MSCTAIAFLDEIQLLSSCNPDVVHRFMRYTEVFVSSAQYDFGKFFSFSIALATSSMC